MIFSYQSRKMWQLNLMPQSYKATYEKVQLSKLYSFSSYIVSMIKTVYTSVLEAIL